MTAIIFITIGLIGAALGSYIGVGGGIIFVPLLLLATNDHAAWIKTISVFAVMVLSATATYRYWRQKRSVNFKIAIIVAIFAIIGGVIATIYINPYMSKTITYISYIVLIILITILMIIKTKIKLAIKENWLLLAFIGILFGAISGIFGIGGGVLYVPVLIILFNYNIKEATPTALVMTGLSAIAIFITHSFDGDIILPKIWLMFLVGIFAIPGSYIGAYLNYKSSPKIIFSAFMLVMLLIVIENIIKLAIEFT